MIAILNKFGISKGIIVLVLLFLAFAGGCHIGGNYVRAVETNKFLVKEIEARMNTEKLQRKSDKIEKELAEALAKRQVRIEYRTKIVEREVVRKIYENPERDNYCALGESDIGLLNGLRIAASVGVPEAPSEFIGEAEGSASDSAGATGNRGAKLSTVISSDIELTKRCGDIAASYAALIDWHEKLQHE
jgi:hypothetical protein